MTPLETDILALSSGTLATLTGYRDCAIIDDVHIDFFTYVRVCLNARGRLRRSWSTWVAAWTDFNAYRQNAYPRYCPEHFYTPLPNSGIALCPQCEIATLRF